MTDSIREFLFALLKLPLIITDWLYDIMLKIFGLNLESSSIVEKYQGVLILYMVVFVTIRLIILYGKFLLEEQEVDIVEWGKRILLAFGGAVALPLILSILFSGVRGFNAISNSIIGYDEAIKPSGIVVSSTAQTPLNSDIEEMNSPSNVITSINDIKINNPNSSGGYTYYDGYDSLFFGILSAWGILFLFANISISFIMKYFLVFLKLILAGYPLASLIDKNSTVFSEWIKGVSSDLMTNAGILLLLKFVFEILGSKELTELNPIVRLVSLVALLLSLSSIESVIARMVGGTDTSGLGMQKLAHFRQATRGLGGMIAGAGAVAGGMAMGGFSGVAQKTGQLLGGKSMNDLAFGGLLGGSQTANSDFQNNDGVINTSHSKNPLGNSIPSNNESNQQSNFTSSSSDGKTKGILEDSKGQTRTNSANEIPKESTIGGTSKGFESSRNYNDNDRVSKEGSRARAFADKVNEMEGFKGFAGRTLSNTTRNLYKASAQRYDKTALRKLNALGQKPTTNTTQNTLNGGHDGI